MDADRIKGWINKLREDPIVGNHTCSVIAECWTDAEIEEEIRRQGLNRWAAVRAWARQVERLYREREREVRSEIF